MVLCDNYAPLTQRTSSPRFRAQCLALARLHGHKKTHQSRRPACSSRETISSRAELEGAQTSTCALGPTACPTRTGGRVSSSPNVPRSLSASLPNTLSLHGPRNISRVCCHCGKTQPGISCTFHMHKTAHSTAKTPKKPSRQTACSPLSSSTSSMLISGMQAGLSVFKLVSSACK